MPSGSMEHIPGALKLILLHENYVRLKKTSQEFTRTHNLALLKCSVTASVHCIKALLFCNVRYKLTDNCTLDKFFIVPVHSCSRCYYYGFINY